MNTPLAAPALLGFTPDGARIVAREWAAGRPATNRAWDVGTGAMVPYDLKHVAASAHGLSHDGTRIAIRHDIRACAVLDARTLDTQCILRGHNEPIAFLAWTVDGSRVVTTSADHTVRLWDAATGAQLAVLDAEHPSSVAVAPDGSGVACRRGGTVHFWDFTVGPSTVLTPDVSYVYHLAWTPDGTRLAASSAYSTRVAIIDVDANRVVQSIDTGEIGKILVFTPDGRHLMTPQTVEVATGKVGPPGAFLIEEWSLADRRGVRAEPGSAMSADGTLLARSGYYDEQPAAVVSDVATGREYVNIVRFGNGVHNKKYAILILDEAIVSFEDAIDLLESGG